MCTGHLAPVTSQNHSKYKETPSNIHRISFFILLFLF